MIAKRTLLVAAASAAIAKPVRAQGLATISFALPSKSIPVAAPRVAAELGLFAKHGLRPNFTYLDSTAVTATALVSKSVDFAITETTSVIAAAARAQNLVIVARHYKGLSAFLVLSKATVQKLGVSPDAPASERLKALNNVLLSGTSRISSTTVSFRQATNALGAVPRFTYMAVGAAPAALEAGAVEGSILTSPYWALLVGKGAAVLWISPATGDIDPAFMPSAPVTTAVTREFAAANPELVRKVAAVFDDLVLAIGQQPDMVKAAYAKVYPEIDEKTLELILSVEMKVMGAGPLTVDDLARDVQYMKNSGGDFGPIGDARLPSLLLER